MKTAKRQISKSGGFISLFIAVVFILGVNAVAETTEFKLDPAHSRIGFSVGHLGISTVQGKFTNYTGSVTLDTKDNSLKGAVATIQADSVDTGIDGRDKHLRNDDFFDVKKYPQIKFKADKATKKNGTWVLKGKFTMHGTTKKLELPLTLKGPIEDPWKNQRIGLEGETTIKRHDYGVGSDKMSDKLVGDEVTLEITLEATAVDK